VNETQVLSRIANQYAEVSEQSVRNLI
jgi:hypothetical protein